MKVYVKLERIEQAPQPAPVVDPAPVASSGGNTSILAAFCRAVGLPGAGQSPSNCTRSFTTNLSQDICNHSEFKYLQVLPRLATQEGVAGFKIAG